MNGILIFEEDKQEMMLGIENDVLTKREKLGILDEITSGNY